LALFPLPKICAEFYPKLFAQSNGAVVTSSKNMYIGPLVTLRRPRGFRQCRAPSWLLLWISVIKNIKQIMSNASKSVNHKLTC
jgi:hypothetical protein